MNGAVSARVGVVGAGQLARMAHRAAIDLAVQLVVLGRRSDDPAVLAGASHLLGDPADFDALERLTRDVDVVTLDHELVPGEHLQALEDAGHRIRPSAAAVLFAQDKWYARTELARRGHPVPAFAAAPDVGAVEAFAAQHGWPVVLKARRGGYDGRGVVLVHGPGELSAVLADGEWLVEAHVDIAVELAVLVARRPGGDQVAYPVVETVQQDGICRELVMPARVGSEVARRAVALACTLVEEIGAVGVVAVELFVGSGGAVLVNEFAFRPHNSGHATIEGSVTSQFENHLRAVLDWPLGSTRMTVPAAVMVNVLGADGGPPPSVRLPRALAIPGAHVHLYGKEPRPGRKLGHVTVLADDVHAGLESARRAAAALVS